MLISNKLLDQLNKDIKTQENLVKLLDKQANDYGTDNSSVINSTKESIEFMCNIVNSCKKN